MSSTPYVALMSRSPRVCEDLESGLAGADALAVHEMPPTAAGTRPVPEQQATDTFKRVKTTLRYAGLGGALGTGLGTVGGLAASTVAATAWLGADVLAPGGTLSDRVLAMWPPLYRTGIFGHALAGAVAKAALAWKPQPPTEAQICGLAADYARGQLAGGAAALGGALAGSFLGNFRAFLFASPAGPVTGILRPSLALAAYCLAAVHYTEWVRAPE